MTKGYKASLIAISSLLTLVIIVGYFYLIKLGEAFGAECENAESWTIGEYEIQEYECLGWGGPLYYPADLYKNGERIDKGRFRKDSCFFMFRPEDDLYLKFDVCNNSFEEIKKNKFRLEIEKVTEVRIKDYQSGEVGILHRRGVEKIAHD